MLTVGGFASIFSSRSGLSANRCRPVRSSITSMRTAPTTAQRIWSFARTRAITTSCMGGSRPARQRATRTPNRVGTATSTTNRATSLRTEHRTTTRPARLSINESAGAGERRTTLAAGTWKIA